MATKVATIESVRVANGRLIESDSVSRNRSPAFSDRVASKLKDVSSAGKQAMQEHRRLKEAAK